VPKLAHDDEDENEMEDDEDKDLRRPSEWSNPAVSPALQIVLTTLSEVVG
jgi:hypothetical protein